MNSLKGKGNERTGEVLAKFRGGPEWVRLRRLHIGASGKLGQYMVQHALDRGYEVVSVCRQRSVGKLDKYKERITVIPGATNDREVI